MVFEQTTLVRFWREPARLSRRVRACLKNPTDGWQRWKWWRASCLPWSRASRPADKMLEKKNRLENFWRVEEFGRSHPGGRMPTSTAARMAAATIGRPALVLHHRVQNQVAIFDAGVVALQINRAGPVHFRPERAAGRAEDGLVVDDLRAVQSDGDMAVHKHDVECLPFARRFFRRHQWFDAAVDRAHVVRVGRFAKAVEDLHLVNATQVNATVAVLRHAGLGV